MADPVQIDPRNQAEAVEAMAGIAMHALQRLSAAREAWLAFRAATTTDAHHAAVAALDVALAIHDHEDHTC